jgi:hypothetical protein
LSRNSGSLKFLESSGPVQACNGLFLPVYAWRVFENTALRKIFVPKRDEVRADWSRLHKEELYGLYSPPNIIRVIKSKRMRCGRGECGAYAGVERYIQGLGARGSLREKDYLEDLYIDGRITLKRKFKNKMYMWTGLSWLSLGTGGKRL